MREAMRPDMHHEPGLYTWKNRWLRGSVLIVGGTVVVALLIGFVWLPSMHGDFTSDGIWSSICRAAGVPQQWGGRRENAPPAARTTDVVLARSMARPGSDEDVGLGATVALQCTVCHGVRGVTGTNAPNLAGQYREVLVKQLNDYRSGNRINAVMQAFAGTLSPSAIDEVAAYYAYLPRATNPLAVAVPRLVRVGDPMRNIAPCATCHGGIDHKLGAPWLEAMPNDYLRTQLTAFASGERHNDSHSQMRNMARRLTAGEVDALVAYYGRR